MIYNSTPLSGSLQSVMEIMQSRSTRSDLPMSNSAKKQLGLQTEKLRNVTKNEHLPLHDLHFWQDVLYQDATSKQWYPATITRLCAQPRSYNIITRESVIYRKTQTHLKSYQPKSKKSEGEYSDIQSSDIWTLKANHKHFDNKKSSTILF